MSGCVTITGHGLRGDNIVAAAAAPVSLPSELRQRIDQRAQTLRREHERALWAQTDRLFAWLFVLQWLAGVVIALWISPRTWIGLDSKIHPHVWAAVFLGGLIAAAPIALVILRPGETLTRYVISGAQAMHSALLIHLSGGRIETHFHVFGSLAFLSFYRDWRALLPATAVVAADHALRGLFWPQSVFGVIAASPWRWLEHAGWVIFEDIFLVWSCVRGAREIAILAQRQAELETSNERVKAEVKRQTVQLESVNQELLTTARRAGMAEIATGVLHNVGNVLNSVNVSANLVRDKLRNSEIGSLGKASEMLKQHKEDLPAFLTADTRGKHLPPFIIEVVECLGNEQKVLLSELEQLTSGLDHIKQIVGAQQQHAKNGTLRQRVNPRDLFEQAIAMEMGMLANDPSLFAREFEDVAPVALDKHKVLQILVNLLSNARKAVLASGRGDARITMSIRTVSAGGAGDARRLQFQVTDNGVGIAAENLTRVFSHGFTTQNEGHGFGLHSAANAAREMQGQLGVTSAGPGQGASFVLDLPMDELTEAEQMMAERAERRRGGSTTNDDSNIAGVIVERKELAA
jgi:signal transduction histidine kinase